MALPGHIRSMKKAGASYGTGVEAGFKPAPTARYGGTVYFHSKDEEGALQASAIEPAVMSF